MFACGCDQRVTFEDLNVVLDEPILDSQPCCKLVEVAGPFLQCADDPCPTLASPGSAEQIPQETAEIRIIGQRTKDLWQQTVAAY